MVLSVLVALMVKDHFAKHAGAIRLTSSRYKHDELLKSVLSAFMTSSGRLVSAGGCIGRRDHRSCDTTSRWMLKSTGLKLSPCGVSIIVANAWQSLDDSRGLSDV